MLVPGSPTPSSWCTQRFWEKITTCNGFVCSFLFIFISNLYFLVRPPIPPWWSDGGEKSEACWCFSRGSTHYWTMHYTLLCWLHFYPRFWPWGRNARAVTSIFCMEAATRSTFPSFPFHPVLTHPLRGCISKEAQAFPHTHLFTAMKYHSLPLTLPA